MKRTLTAFALVSALAATLAGCAAPAVRIETDDAKVSAVERAARIHGIQVVWINTPQKRTRLPDGT